MCDRRREERRLVDEGRQREHELAARAARAIEQAAAEVDRSVMLHRVVQVLHVNGVDVTSCAWCDRYHIGDGWYSEDASRLILALAASHRLTHGICPDCFAEVAPAGVDYPAAELPL
jgi:hypothetical protein